MTVQHDEQAQQFIVEFAPYRAVLLYARRDDVLDFYHIYVPDPYRGGGVAGRILIAAFDYARRNNFRVVPSCPFIRHDFVPRFDRYHDLIDSGVFPFA